MARLTGGRLVGGRSGCGGRSDWGSVGRLLRDEFPSTRPQLFPFSRFARYCIAGDLASVYTVRIGGSPTWPSRWLVGISGCRWCCWNPGAGSAPDRSTPFPLVSPVLLLRKVGGSCCGWRPRISPGEGCGPSTSRCWGSGPLPAEKMRGWPCFKAIGSCWKLAPVFMDANIRGCP